MKITFFKYILFLLFLSITHRLMAMPAYEEKHLNVALRMIGHQVLLSAGDSTSRVLSINKKGEQYAIFFEAPFAFQPEELIPTISCVMEDAHIHNGYIVEVIHEGTGDVIYNYEMASTGYINILPCTLRNQPKERYSILVTVKPDETQILTAPKPSSNHNYLALAFLTFCAAVGFVYWYKREKPAHANSQDAVSIGQTQFDEKSMKLVIQNQQIELTHKEASLLSLLHASANTTLERELILQKVWGDEGDYIGRTLDVYISKLRKKIELDTSLEIINIRGVGYRLVVKD